MKHQLALMSEAQMGKPALFFRWC